MKKIKTRKVIEEVDDETWHCDKCGAALHEPGCESRRERLRVYVSYGENVAHQGDADLVDYEGDFCESCVKANTALGEDHRRNLLTYKEETARYLERVAELIRSTDEKEKAR